MREHGERGVEIGSLPDLSQLPRATITREYVRQSLIRYAEFTGSAAWNKVSNLSDDELTELSKTLLILSTAMLIRELCLNSINADPKKTA